MIFDIIVFSLIVLFLFTGFRRGFFVEAISLCVWAGSIIGPYYFYPQLLPHVKPFIHHKALALSATTSVLFVAFFVFLSIIGDMLKKAISLGNMKGTDQILGSVLGLGKGIIVTTFLYVMSLDYFPNNLRAEKTEPFLRQVYALYEEHFSDLDLRALPKHEFHQE